LTIGNHRAVGKARGATKDESSAFRAWPGRVAGRSADGRTIGYF